MSGKADKGFTQKVSQGSIWEHEAAFHDRWADDTDIDDTLVRESFESPLAQENRLAMQLMGNLQGKKLLDVGTGLGEAAVYFALQEAQVVAIDISAKMVRHAQQLALYYGTQIEGIVCPAEELCVPDNYVDICYSANLMHHIKDQERVLREIYRVLKPGGLVVTWDPLAYNPVINIYRRMADSVRTEDEKPLTFSIVREYQKVFENVRHYEFWFSALLIFLKYYLIDGIHPNQDRYWRHILKESQPTLTWIAPLISLDRCLLRFAPFKYMAWTILISGQKADNDSQNK